MVTADHTIVTLIVSGAVGYLIRSLRSKKKTDCCGNRLNGKRGCKGR